MKKFKEFAESCDLFDQNTDGTKEFIKAHGKADTPLTGKLATDGQFKSSKAKAKNGGYEGEADEEAYEKANPKTKKSSKKDDDDDYNRINNYQYESSIDLEKEGIELTEEEELLEIKLSMPQKLKRDLIYKKLKNQMFKYRQYGKKARTKMYSDATKLARGITSESEQLNELSKKTLGSYVRKASNDGANRAFLGGRAIERGEPSNMMNHTDKAFKRHRGIKKAVERLTKESEQLDELSDETLKSYKEKAGSQVDHLMKKNKNFNRPAVWKSEADQYVKRRNGLERADKTLKKRWTDRHLATMSPEDQKTWKSYHESEQLDELSLDTLKSYRKKALRAPANMDRPDHDYRFKGIERADSQINKKTAEIARSKLKESREETLKLIAEKIIYAAVAEEYFSDDDLELLMLDLEELLSLEGIE